MQKEKTLLTTALWYNISAYTHTEINENLLGKILTILDASIQDVVQRKALKDIVRQAFYHQENELEDIVRAALTRAHNLLEKDSKTGSTEDWHAHFSPDAPPQVGVDWIAKDEDIDITG